jgi:SM-20-related protein
MDAIDLAAFRATVLTRQPFAHLVVPGFIKAEARAAINADYPRIEAPGSFPASELRYGPAFAALLGELTGPELCEAFEDKFQVSLKNHPTMITVRGRCGTRDGHIHTDAETKIITVLVYMNPSWEDPGGRLRLLRSAHDLDDLLLEVPPTEGTLLAFRRSASSFHGHKRFVGPRRVVQLNWVTSRLVKHSELMRHRLSAWMKKLGTWVGAPAASDPTALR